MSVKKLTPELLVQAYSQGVFPMADTATSDEVFWVEPKMRGVMPLDGFHISRSLGRALRNCGYEITLNKNFPAVMAACADRPETWINPMITNAYVNFHERGLAHSVEVWNGEELVGGVYGVALNAAFFGESMFSHVKNGSKIALTHLINQLNATGFKLFDTQFITPHLASMGGQEIPQSAFLVSLDDALAHPADISSRPLINPYGQDYSGTAQDNNQTS
ncbi:MAG: leucyl/phenylalanyl-tRNA--protein transferase [Paracoccaceae bacterium]|nr:leucyl/phenylalanyl-tRNA--protein transferase [Paracoccaceae bacterium]